MATASAEEVVKFEVRNRVAKITFSRPEKLNALNKELLERSTGLVREMAEDPEIGCIVVTGEGRAFCAGGDVSTFANKNAEPMPLEHQIDRLRAGQEFPWLLHSIPKVTLAQARGIH